MTQMFKMTFVLPDGKAQEVDIADAAVAAFVAAINQAAAIRSGAFSFPNEAAAS